MNHLITPILILSFCFPTIGQVITDSILVEGHFRSFHYNKPKDLNKPSLVFALHGSGGNGRNVMRQAVKLEDIAVKENVLVVYPNGYRNFWNECRAASPAVANKENINEEAFFLAMISYFHERFKIDTAKVFVIGTSGGGHMAYKLALTIPDNFRAITAIIANLPDSTNFDCVAVSKPMAVMIINGTADKINPYNGGEVNIGFSLGIVRSTNDTFQYWAKLAGYYGEALKDTLPDTDPSDNKTIERFSFSEKGKPEIVLLKVIGGEHNYPNDIDVYVEAWQFFKRQINR